jgi:hypothetical protein
MSVIASANSFENAVCRFAFKRKLTRGPNSKAVTVSA